ncbi:hypothetical protein Bpfe_016636 [Biomphalaria pfeifferi]|uniref:Uncharacterized protein n=1 Tax=Biomphalaria pfeifferi TaxID=112525 RepID=A0AAD8BFX6_BIOPF|nr:hypothetical protein Bpfe_016636 [Biomphalaria pfeifferi]
MFGNTGIACSPEILVRVVRPYTNAIKNSALKSTSPPVSDRIQTPSKTLLYNRHPLLYQTVYKRHQKLCFTIDIPSCIRPYTNAIKTSALQSTSSPVSDRIQTPSKPLLYNRHPLLYQTVYKRHQNLCFTIDILSCIRPYTNAIKTSALQSTSSPVSDRIQTPSKPLLYNRHPLLYEHVTYFSSAPLIVKNCVRFVGLNEQPILLYLMTYLSMVY